MVAYLVAYLVAHLLLAASSLASFVSLLEVLEWICGGERKWYVA